MSAIAKNRKRSYTKVRARAGYVFILPWIIGFLLFFLRPLIESFIFTFHDVVNGAAGFEKTPVGLDNYSFLLFSDATYLPLLGESILNMVTEVVIITIFSLLIAVLLNQQFHGRTFYRAVFFLPIILTSGVVFTMMSSVVNAGSTTSAQNAYMFQSAGLKDLLLQGNVSPDVVNFISNTVDRIFSLISKSGVQILLFISGLKKIPSSAYEAVKIEGASGWDAFWKITIPMVSPVVFLNIVYTIIDSFTAYGTENSGNRMMAAINSMGFGKIMKFGYSATMAWIYFATIIVILGIVFVTIGRSLSKVSE